MPSFWQKIRKDFPIAKDCIYLDHAAGGPIPVPVLSKIQAHYQSNALKADFAWMDWISQREEVRKKVADFIHADPSEITFIQSTSQGMNLIADMISRQGTVLTNSCEFPSSTLPWIWRKSKMIFQEPDENEVSLLKMKSLLSPSVKTLVTSFVQYSTGFRQNMEALGQMKGGRYLVVNATQGFGAFPVDVQKWNVDFLCTNSYKWLMAGYGGGVLYIRKKWLSKFKPSSIGWRSMAEPERMDNLRIDVKRDASRYEMGCPPFPAIFAVGAAVDYLSSIGMERIQKRILELTDFAIEALEKKGYEVVSPREPKHRSGIVVFKMEKAQTLWKRLLAKKIYVSARGAGIRVAPHFYNSFEDIEKLVRAL